MAGVMRAMNVLTRTAFSNVNISTKRTVLSYRVEATVLVVIQVNLSNCESDSYIVQVYVDEALVVPDKPVPSSSVDNMVAQSRSVIVEDGSLLEVKITGQAGDTAISGAVVVVDATPVSTQDVIDSIIPQLNAAVLEGLSTLEVRPTVHVLGPIPRRTVWNVSPESSN